MDMPGEWLDVEPGIEDGEYVTVIQVDDQVEVEIAPWRNGKYQGSRYMLVYLGIAKVLKYMILPPLEMDITIKKIDKEKEK